MFLRDLQLIRGWIVICEISHELYIFYCIPNRCKIEKPDTLQHNGMKYSEMKMRMWK